MRKYFTAFQMTQSMFCSLPFPCRNWDEECRPYMLLFLPVVGMEIGILWVFVSGILQYFHIPKMLYALLMCALPYLTTGFMHLDGFMDVVDAVCSWRDLEKRRQILKDSHVGSFAVVWCVFLILAGFAVFASVNERANIGCLVLIPMVSRCFSAMSIMHLKPMNTSQYSRIIYPKWHKFVLTAVVCICILLGFMVFGKYGYVVIVEIIAYGIALKKSTDSLQGMNGDISGFCVCISELCAVIVLACI